MRRIFAAGALAGLAGACQPAPHVQRPPARYQADRTVVAVLTADPAGACRRLGAVAAEGAQIVACHHAGTIVLLNPCLIPAGESDFAGDACHELGHANGWPANHPVQ